MHCLNHQRVGGIWLKICIIISTNMGLFFQTNDNRFKIGKNIPSKEIYPAKFVSFYQKHRPQEFAFGVSDFLKGQDNGCHTLISSGFLTTALALEFRLFFQDLSEKSPSRLPLPYGYLELAAHNVCCWSTFCIRIVDTSRPGQCWV